MYEFRPILPRIERMRVAVRDRLIVADADKAALKLEAIKEYMAYPPMLKKPYMSLYVISRMPINLLDDDYFVGDMGNRGWGAADGSKWLMADIEHTWPIEADGLHHAPLDDPLYSKQLMAIAPEDLKRLRDGDYSRSLMRRLGRSAVSLYSWDYEKLRETGVIDGIAEKSAILNDMSFYDPMCGLKMDSEPGRGIWS